MIRLQPPVALRPKTSRTAKRFPREPPKRRVRLQPQEETHHASTYLDYDRIGHRFRRRRGRARFAAENTATASPAKVAETRAALRDLWSEHVFWVRNVVWATLEKNQSARAAAEAQVVANARQIADSITPFYGKPAADQLFELLKEHYGPIPQYLDASIANDAAGRDRAQKALSANAGAIAKFLSGANPHLPYDAVNGLLLAHGAHHVAQIDQLKSGKYAQEAQTWTAMRTHMNTIADAIGDALAKQFPAKFR